MGSRIPYSAAPLVLAAALLSIAASGCDRLPFGYLSVSEVVQKAGAYEGKTVKVKGAVSDVVQLPFVAFRYYVIKQGDAEIVVFPSGNVPAKGDQVSVIGTVSSLAVVGDTSIGLHIIEKEHW